MNLKKVYYYSPEKLKLVPIQNVFGKIVAFLTFFALSISFLVFAISSKYFSSTSLGVLEEQKLQIEKEYKKEIIALNKKYIQLAEKFENIATHSNELRLAVNLEPLNFENNDFGIGGSKLVDLKKPMLEFSDLKLASIYQNISNLEKSLNYESSNFEEISTKYTENIDLFDKIPAIRPVNCAIGDRFGMRFHPILKRKRMHHGLDFLANTGEKIYAPGDGIVSYVGTRGGYGKVVRINHGYGYETLYAHLSKYKVKKGQKVKRGDIIALSGNSGSLSTGPHLHYEVRHNGICLNPRNFIFENTKLFEGQYKNILASK